MNLQRGLWRLWIVVALVWVIAVAWIWEPEGPFTAIPKLTDGWVAQEELEAARSQARADAQARVATGQPPPLKSEADQNAALRGVNQIFARIERGKRAQNSLLGMAFFRIALPAILLAAGVVIGWVIRGFRSS